MGSFETLTGAKKHNAPGAVVAKVTLRRHLLSAIGPDRAHVFDAYAGPGAMHAAVWREAASYVGCDTEWFRDERRVFVADNQLVMRALDLAAFNLFDLDAFGSPWETATILAARRRLLPGERVGLAVTDGCGLKLKMSGVPHALARLVGLDASTVKLANRAHDLMVGKALAEVACRMNARVARHWQASQGQRASMRYHALVLEGLAQASSGS